MPLADIPNKFNEIKNSIESLKFSDLKLTSDFRSAFEQHISENSSHGYSSVEWATFSTKIITSSGRSIYLPNYWFQLSFELASFLESLSEQKVIFETIFNGENLYDIATEFKKNGIIPSDKESKISSYFTASNLSNDELESFKKFISDYSSWGGGKTIDRGDYYESPLLKAGNLLAESQSAIAEIADIFYRSSAVSQAFKPTFITPVSTPSTKHNLTVVPKPFILLAGHSGTGKTRFVRKQAEVHEMNGKNFCLVPVRPDWHEPSDLLGYVSRISGTRYVATEALKFIVEAWKAVAPNASKAGMGELDLDSAPYWLCLDEMNLAPVEQYFADYLSVLESREFKQGVYSCEALLDKTVLESVSGIRDELGLENEPELWEFFRENGISLPPNLIVAGTVNMDETTHGFSRKVIDRAVSIDFGKFYPNDYDRFFGGQAQPKTLTYSTQTHADKAALRNTIDPEGEKTKNFLKSVNDILNNTPFELAYRALNELFLFVIAFAPKDEEGLQAVWDDFLMTKVLPRIDGDDDKLRSTNKDDNNNILDQLESLLSKELDSIWYNTRIDLLRTEDEADIKNIACRTREKIAWMKDRLEKNTFTSYWP